MKDDIAANQVRELTGEITDELASCGSADLAYDYTRRGTMLFNANELLCKYGAAIKAADAILAPLTMEVGRLLEEAPTHEITIVAFGEEIKLTAKHFMDLYRATE